ncbi:hypothetical protein TRFO_02418 [Tritrichomonas foetus]|uniref:Uncharacterized protein n=1 Tax=Tritrichomonas foetus TaxID=1144522 RepID=A0A1J4J8Z1_9EUKA|nr:hypothetical protein TRFO_02418 [Tritrichomonas foetus]|eukprot:OHS93877.1 hypothetical protein TRFO_02418 [Tritrichomonas foetus]
MIQEAIRQSLIEAKERENSVPQKMLHEEKELAEIQFNEICSVVYNPEKIIEILEKLEGVNPYDPIFHDFVRA